MGLEGVNKEVMIVPVTLDSANRKKDRSVSFKFTTNFEISNKDFAGYDKKVQTIGWLAYRSNEGLSPLDLPKEQAPLEFGQKRPSVRLRNVLYRVWEQTTDQAEDFETQYYPRIMEKIIDKYKEVLV